MCAKFCDFFFFKSSFISYTWHTHNWGSKDNSGNIFSSKLIYILERDASTILVFLIYWNFEKKYCVLHTSFFLNLHKYWLLNSLCRGILFIHPPAANLRVITDLKLKCFEHRSQKGYVSWFFFQVFSACHNKDIRGSRNIAIFWIVTFQFFIFYGSCVVDA